MKDFAKFSVRLDPIILNGNITSSGLVDTTGLNVPLFVGFRRVKAKSFREFNLHPNGRRINLGDNISDSSLASEAYSAHIMGYTFESVGCQTTIRNVETNIRYKYTHSKKADYIIQLKKPLDGVDILAVEVKRLSSFGGYNELTEFYVHNLLTKANLGALESNRMVHPEDRWHTQILHVITDSLESIPIIADWCRQIETPGFSGIFVTYIQGNTHIIMGR